MLVRADPTTDSLSMLSFPRDLRAEIHCPSSRFFDRINQAYASCGPEGSLETVKALTGLPINYLITINFRGFKQLVAKVGGVWMDVDRRYFNDNTSGGERYAAIDLQPGYQKLNGQKTLDFVRFRHTDSDLYRNARQQMFVRALKEQVSHSFAPTTMPKIIDAISDNVKVAAGGKSKVSLKTILTYAVFAYHLPPGHLFQSRIEELSDFQGFNGAQELTASESEIQRAVQEFNTPDVEAAEKATAVALQRKLAKKKQNAPPPNRVTLVALNGNGITGLGDERLGPARRARLQLIAAGEQRQGRRAELELLPQPRLLPAVEARRRGGREGGGEPRRERGRPEDARREAARGSRARRCSRSWSARRSTERSRLPRSTGRRSASRRRSSAIRRRACRSCARCGARSTSR